MGHLLRLGHVHGVEAAAAEIAHDQHAVAVASHAVQEGDAGNRKNADFRRRLQVIGPDDVVADGVEVTAEDLHAMRSLRLTEKAPIGALVGRHQQAAAIAHEPPVAFRIVFDGFDVVGRLGAHRAREGQGEKKGGESHGGKVPPPPVNRRGCRNPPGRAARPPRPPGRCRRCRRCRSRTCTRIRPGSAGGRAPRCCRCHRGRQGRCRRRG